MDNAWRRLRDRTLVPKEKPRSLYVSNNDKTGFSINTPIALTCRPTKLCAQTCYALSGPIAFPTAVARQAQNWLRFEHLEDASQAEVDREADRLAALILPHQDWLRFFGGGDLQPGSVRLINAVVKRCPDLTLWVATRRLDLAEGLNGGRSLHLMLSTDRTTTPDFWKKARVQIAKRRGQAFIAYVQEKADETVPDDVLVIFAMHRPGGWRAPWSGEAKDARLCPATIDGGAPHKDACDSCRRCFDLERRK